MCSIPRGRAIYRVEREQRRYEFVEKVGWDSIGGAMSTAQLNRTNETTHISSPAANFT
jgi:hypothetical protein